MMLNTVKTATVQETKKELDANPSALMIDVREKVEVDELAPTVGTFFPMSQIDPSTFDVDCKVAKDQPLYIFCRSGGRSMRVAMALAEAGFSNITNVAGGIIAWDEAGLPVKRGHS
ncbi:MAG: rhodanese-like domain-containing protein [Gammaproteobacteria bacterium]|nr:rhodanese-like domain-containing protein [Gammaproteobacteria bacterium]